MPAQATRAGDIAVSVQPAWTKPVHDESATYSEIAGCRLIGSAYYAPATRLFVFHTPIDGGASNVRNPARKNVMQLLAIANRDGIESISLAFGREATYPRVSSRERDTAAGVDVIQLRYQPVQGCMLGSSIEPG
ncbi:MAG TPA: hypothetical protein VHE81_16495 [Lacipirellulaceae bacterium]|nr:hypothetical protein [Lacipirellulaceae bacterium]